MFGDRVAGWLAMHALCCLCLLPLASSTSQVGAAPSTSLHLLPFPTRQCDPTPLLCSASWPQHRCVSCAVLPPPLPVQTTPRASLVLALCFYARLVPLAAGHYPTPESTASDFQRNATARALRRHTGQSPFFVDAHPVRPHGRVQEVQHGWCADARTTACLGAAAIVRLLLWAEVRHKLFPGQFRQRSPVYLAGTVPDPV